MATYSQDQLAKFVQTFLDSFQTISPITSGASDIYRIQADDGNFVLKILDLKNIKKETSSPLSGDPVENLKEELNLISFYNSNKIHTPKSVKSINNNFIEDVDGVYIYMFEEAQGHHVHNKLSEKIFLHIGNILADMHNLAESNNLKIARQWVPGNIWTMRLKNIDWWLERGPNTDLKERLLNLKAEIKKNEFKLSQLPFIQIHGDPHLGNFLFNDKDELTAVLDYGMARMGHAIEDTIRFVSYDQFFDTLNHSGRPLHFSGLMLKVFIDSYLAKRSLTETEVELMPLYLKMSTIKYLWKVNKDERNYKKYINTFENLCTLTTLIQV